MSTKALLLLLLFGFVGHSASLFASPLIEDQGVSMTKDELEFIVANWPEKMQQDAANDVGDRMELLNQAMLSKKVAVAAAEMTAEKDGEAYWQKELLVRQALLKFMRQRYVDERQPSKDDLVAIARERYAAEKDKYAWVQPSRLSSHILLRCENSKDCDLKSLEASADNLLLELRAGANFEEKVLEYSQDPGSKNQKGLLDKWLTRRMNNIDRAYLKGVFSIDKEGDYSDVVVSNFGFHIIRLEGIREGYYKSFDEVRPRILKDLIAEYNALLVKIYDAEYILSDETKVDGEAMEEVFGKYKTVE